MLFPSNLKSLAFRTYVEEVVSFIMLQSIRIHLELPIVKCLSFHNYVNNYLQYGEIVGSLTETQTFERDKVVT